MAILGTTVLHPAVRLLQLKAVRRDPGGELDITVEYVFYVGAVPHLGTYTMLNQSTADAGVLNDTINALINDEITPYFE